MTLWTAPRIWKGKTCHLHLRSKVQADLYLADGEGVPTTQFPAYSVMEPNAEETGSYNAGLHILTDLRFGEDDGKGQVRWVFMGEGVMSGLEERRDHLPGRFVVTKAIGLAVHLGASVIYLVGEVHSRAARNLDTMRRPLKGARVRLIEGVTVECV